MHRRSELVTPGDSMAMLEKAAGSDADQVVMDLEDAVAPTDKSAARDRVIEAATRLEWGGKRLSVRINPLGTADGYQDIVAVVGETGDRLDTLVVPKVRGPRDVYAVERLLSGVEAANAVEKPVGLEPMIEHVEAVQRADDIAGASDRNETLIFGPVDYASTLMGIVPPGGPPDTSTYHADLYRFVRITIVHAASAHGLDPIDCTGIGNFTDLEAFRRDCETGKGLGVTGYWAIHPAQVDIVNDVFTPDAADIAYARRVVEAMAEAEAAGEGAAIRLDDQLVDTAHARVARRILDRA